MNPRNPERAGVADHRWSDRLWDDLCAQPMAPLLREAVASGRRGACLYFVARRQLSAQQELARRCAALPACIRCLGSLPTRELNERFERAGAEVLAEALRGLDAARRRALVRGIDEASLAYAAAALHQPVGRPNVLPEPNDADRMALQQSVEAFKSGLRRRGVVSRLGRSLLAETWRTLDTQLRDAVVRTERGPLSRGLRRVEPLHKLSPAGRRWVSSVIERWYSVKVAPSMAASDVGGANDA